MMTDTDDIARQRVVAEARSWVGTPYHHNQRVKGGGVDCANLPAAVYAAANVISPIPAEEYSPQWHLHQSPERYLGRVLENATEFDGPPGPGDFVLWKVGRCYAHGAIVVEWPIIIHAVAGQGVILGNALRDPFDRKVLKDREPRYFTLWGA